jgi:uncharacterized cupin superfamily protein
MAQTPYSQYIVDPRKISKLSEGSVLTVKSTYANFSAQIGFKKLGIHHVVLAPGTQTSLPHAESLEEEFVFVIAGHPHLWCDGWMHELKPHCAVGFPSGTGIGHCLINNTDKDVELFVVGERTKKGNRFFNIVNPEQNDNPELFWADAPKRELGPHCGKPGKVLPSELGREWPSCVVDCSTLERSGGFTYPGDNETFGAYAGLTDRLGLKVLGIGYELLAPGKRSCFPHAHKVEEEFAFVLSGAPTVWMNGFTEEVQPLNGVGFLADSNISHVLINDTTEPVLYLAVGEAQGDDLIYYPMHEFRNDQCRVKKNFFWEERPQGLPFGEHTGRPKKGIPDHLSFRKFEKQDEPWALDQFKKPFTSDQMLGQHEKIVIELNDKSVGMIEVRIHSNSPESATVEFFETLELPNKNEIQKIAQDLLQDYLKRIFNVEI